MILVTGATGFLGGYILAKLTKEFGPDYVIGTGRNITKAESLKVQGYSLVTGDLCDADFVRSKFGEVTQIVHCAARSSLWGSFEDFYKDNVIPTINLLQLIPSCRRFVFISTPSVYFSYSHRFNVKESDPLPDRFVNDYAATKYLAEQEVLNHQGSGMICTVIRPRAILGAGDTVIIPRVIRAFEAGRLKVIGDGKCICDFSSAKNIAHAVYLALQANNLIDRKIFNITDDQPQALWPLLENTLHKLGFQFKLGKINYHLVFGIASISEWIARVFRRGEPVLTKYGVGLLNYSLTMDISEARKYLNYKPIISTEESIDEFIQNWHG